VGWQLVDRQRFGHVVFFQVPWTVVFSQRQSFLQYALHASSPAMTASDPTAHPTIVAGSFLTLHYRLSGPQGDVINTFQDKPATLSLGSGELSPALEQRLLGLHEGDRTTFQVPAGEAFGERNPDMQQWVSKTLLKEFGDPDEQYTPGDVVQFPAPNGQGSFAGAVQQVSDDAVLFDFNHPLANQPVTFEVQIIGIL
jgi:FKBP-type peptidyl-prolyl cis-trans isomerase SlpA